jgi:mannose-6-phosphate isomerase-like protein (cupin superfamily)
VDIRNAARLESQQTLDQSRVTELLHPRGDRIEGCSIAQAIVPPGSSTLRHVHRRSEETYYILDGDALMEVAGESERVGPGDAILIPVGAPHRITAVSPGQLRLLCICCPAYADDDTELLEPVAV